MLRALLIHVQALHFLVQTAAEAMQEVLLPQLAGRLIGVFATPVRHVRVTRGLQSV